jgi:RES domain-containing protein
MPVGWRIVKTRYQSNAFDGEGSRLYAGRWNSKGVRVVYISENISLALLELLIHLNESNILNRFSLCSVHFDEKLVSRIDRSTLPKNWKASPIPPETQLIGDTWAKNLESAVLSVPSVIVEQESNYIINPLHPDFRKIRIADPVPFSLDTRLLR